MRRLLLLLVVLPVTAHAQQRWPLQFDPALAANPADVTQLLADGEQQLPPLPLTSLQQVDVGPVKLWFFPELVAQQERASTVGAGEAQWPRTPVMCAGHAAFAIPALLVDGAGSQCLTADASVRSRLMDLRACRLVEEPEIFVESIPPAEVTATSTSSLEKLIGIAGEALRHPPLPPGLLPDDFVPTLRSILVKLRETILVQSLTSARTRYDEARMLLSQNPSCFRADESAQLSSSITTLIAELDAARAHIDQLRSDGEAEHAREELHLGARARARRTLPFPSLTAAERRFTAFWLGGVYWRMRGGGLIPLGSTMQARYYFLQRPFTEIGELTGGDDGADAANRIYLAIFEGWGEWMDMGRTAGGDDKYSDLLRMTRRGERQVLSAKQLLEERNYDGSMLLTGGLQMGPCYFHAWDVLASFRYADMLMDPYGPFIEFPTAVGEFCTGAAIGLGLADTLLNGFSTGMPPTCTADCSGRVCGDDGCGGDCGTCGDGVACMAGACVTSSSTDGSSSSATGSSSSGTTTSSSTGLSSASSASPSSGAASSSTVHASGSSAIAVSSSSAANGGTGDEATGCACQSSGRLGPSGVLALGALFLRRRRSAH